VAAAVEILRAGGNAFDAAIAAAFASTIAEPALTSLGGGGFLLARTAERRTILFDFFVDTPGLGRPGSPGEIPLVPVKVSFPGAEQVFHAGPGSIAVPGNLRGFLHVHRRLGRLPLGAVLAPARQLAVGGVVLNAWQSYVLGLLVPIMTMHADGCTLFAPGGRYLGEGSSYRNLALADFLASVERDGEAAFYEGELAAALVDVVREEGGALTRQDLAGYRVVEREPLEVAYRDLRLLTNPPPSFGGSLLALSLRLMESRGLAGGDWGGASHLALLVAVMREVDELRARGIWQLDQLDDAELATARNRIRTASGGTTHVSVCDEQGNVASLTTSNGEGSGSFMPGTGIMMNNMMGEDDLHPLGFHACPAGTRVASMMAPSIVLDGDAVELALGSGGSKRIRTALLQVISNVVDFGWDVGAAVEAPRLHWDGELVQVEPGFDATAIAGLGTINRWDRADVYFGGVHAVSPRGRAAGDPRRGGCGVVL